MRRKYLALMMGIVMAAVPVSAFAEESTMEVTVQEMPGADDVLEAAEEGGMKNTAPDEAEAGLEADGTVLQGEVTGIEADSITIVLRSMGGMDGGAGNMGAVPEKPGEGGAASEEEPGAAEDAEMLGDPEEETVTITVTDDTVIQKQSGMGGGIPSGGEMGEAPSGDGAGQEMGEAPSAEGAGGEMGEIPSAEGAGGEMEEISLEEIEVGDTVSVTLNDDGTAASITVQNGMGGGMPGGMGGGTMGISGVDSYDAVLTYEEDTEVENETVSSTGTDENAILIDGDAQVKLSNMTIEKVSDDSTGGDNSSFYGVGAAVLGTEGTTVICDSMISTDSQGGAGVFAYGDAVVYVQDTDITTVQDTSGGIHAAGGGTLYAWNVTAETNGTSSAAVRSDRGGGTMVVDGGTYTSNGPDSPAVYCTADISIDNAVLTANGSEAVCIEGLNTLRLYECDLTGSMPDDERNENTWTVIIYQSMSGDSEVGNGTFQMSGGTLTSNNGGLFYTTNTECTITLENVEIISSEDSEFFLQCTGNINSRGWGTEGANGSDCLFTAIDQTMDGDVIWDSISTLDFYVTEGSTLTGAIINDESYAGNGGSGYCNVVLDNTSVWVVTGDSIVTSLQNGGSIVDAEGNSVTIAGADGTVYVEGSSAYTITVESYTEEADVSGASVTDSWEEHAVEQPEI